MTMYVEYLRDQGRSPRKKKSGVICRLFTDPTDDLSKLIDFGKSIGLPETALHRTVMPHFDIDEVKRQEAIWRSAQVVGMVRAREIEEAWRRFWNDR